MRAFYFGKLRKAALGSGNASSLSRFNLENWPFARSNSFTLILLLVTHSHIGKSVALWPVTIVF